MKFNNTYSLVTIVVILFAASTSVCQENNPHSKQDISSYLSIPCVARIVVIDTLWYDIYLPPGFFGKLPRGWKKPVIIPKKISVETNCTPVKVFLEMASEKGNLRKGIKDIRTYYCFRPIPRDKEKVKGQAWMTGREIRNKSFGVERSGKHQWVLLAAVIPDSLTEDGVYSEDISIIAFDKFGQKYERSFPLEYIVEGFDRSRDNKNRKR